MKAKIVLYPTFGVEVGCLDRGRPSYRWVQGYAHRMENGGESMTLPLREWRAIAKRDGLRIKLCDLPRKAPR